MMISRSIRHFIPIVICIAAVWGYSKSPSERTESASTTANSTFPATSESPATDGKSEPAFYSVSEYDKSRDPKIDLLITINRAKIENKRILLQVGGDWCGWCARISEYMANNDAVRELLNRHFIVMKVTYPGEYAKDFLSQYPTCEGYPHLFVLEQDGTLLHSQDSGKLEQGNSYNQGIFIRFLTEWAIPSKASPK